MTDPQDKAREQFKLGIQRLNAALEAGYKQAKCDKLRHQMGYAKCPNCSEDPTAKAREIASNYNLEKAFTKNGYKEFISDLAAAIEAERKAGREEALKPYEHYTLPNGDEVNVLTDTVFLCNESYNIGYTDGVALGPGFPNRAYEEGKKAGREEVIERCRQELADMRGKCYSKVAEQDIRKADAEGYRRGLEEAAEIAEYSSRTSVTNMMDLQAQIANEIRQRGKR